MYSQGPTRTKSLWKLWKAALPPSVCCAIAIAGLDSEMEGEASGGRFSVERKEKKSSFGSEEEASFKDVAFAARTIEERSWLRPDYAQRGARLRREHLSFDIRPTGGVLASASCKRLRGTQGLAAGAGVAV